MINIKDFSNQQVIVDATQQLQLSKNGDSLEFFVFNNPGGNTNLLNHFQHHLDLALQRGVDVSFTFHGDIASCAATLLADVTIDVQTYHNLTFQFVYPVRLVFHKPRLIINDTKFPPLQAIDYNSYVQGINDDDIHFKASLDAFMLWYETNYNAKLNKVARNHLYDTNQDVQFLLNEASDD